MPTINEGSSVEVEVEAGRVLTVETQGRARVYRRVGLSDAGQYDAPVVVSEDEFGPLPLDATYTIEALGGDAEYTVAWPLVPSLPFRRNDDGSIDAVMDGAVAIPLAAEPGDVTVTWGDVTGKPATFPPTIGTTATTAMAGNTPIPPAATWANLSGKPAVIGAGADAAAARTAIGAGTGNSNLAIGTTASTAAAGNHNHDGTYATVAALAALEARVEALEGAGG